MGQAKVGSSGTGEGRVKWDRRRQGQVGQAKARSSGTGEGKVKWDRRR